MRLNLGCGRHVLEGWFNVDAQASPRAPRAPELLSDLRKIDLPDACADEVMAIHVFEHFYHWDAPLVLREWRRLLKPGGKLALELPDLIKCCQNVIDGRMKGGKDPNQLGMWGLFGDPREQDQYMVHRWGWTPTTLRKLLELEGFVGVKQEPTKWHPAGRDHRDMRIVSTKG